MPATTFTGAVPAIVGALLVGAAGVVGVVGVIGEVGAVGDDCVSAVSPEPPPHPANSSPAPSITQHARSARPSLATSIIPGNPAVVGQLDRWLCVSAFRRICPFQVTRLSTVQTPTRKPSRFSDEMT